MIRVSFKKEELRKETRVKENIHNLSVFENYLSEEISNTKGIETEDNLLKRYNFFLKQ